MAQAPKTEYDIIMDTFNQWGNLIPNDELKKGMAQEMIKQLQFNGMLVDPSDGSSRMDPIVKDEEGNFMGLEELETKHATEMKVPEEVVTAIPTESLEAVKAVKAKEEVKAKVKAKVKTKSKKAPQKRPRKKGSWIGG